MIDTSRNKMGMSQVGIVVKISESKEGHQTVNVAGVDGADVVRDRGRDLTIDVPVVTCRIDSFAKRMAPDNAVPSSMGAKNMEKRNISQNFQEGTLGMNTHLGWDSGRGSALKQGNPMGSDSPGGNTEGDSDPIWDSRTLDSVGLNAGDIASEADGTAKDGDSFRISTPLIVLIAILSRLNLQMAKTLKIATASGRWAPLIALNSMNTYQELTMEAQSCETMNWA